MNNVKNRCLCIPSFKWEDKKKLQEYISAKAILLKDSAKCTDIMDRGRGLTSLLDLKETHWSSESIERTRALIQEEIPFRTQMCTKVVNCCGLCTIKCLHRCVQDVYQRLYSVVFKLHIGLVTEEEVSRDILAAYKTMCDPRTSYEELVETVNAFIEKEEEHYANYTCEEEYYQTKTGTYRKRTNPETGEVMLLNWPVSGLCPFCVPRVLYYKNRNSRGTASSR